MSTRSTIGILNDDGTVTSVYCHDGGEPDTYPLCVGQMLRTHYTDPAKVRALIALGMLSSLGREIGTKHDWTNRTDAECHAYARDRGDMGCGASECDGVEEYLRANHGTAYTYLFREGRWFYAEARSTDLAPVPGLETEDGAGEAPAAAAPPAFTVIVTRGRADRLDNRQTKTYGVELRWFARAERLDVDTLHRVTNYSGRWGDEAFTAKVAARFPEASQVRGAWRGWDEFDVRAFFPSARPRDIPANAWSAAGEDGEARIRDVVTALLTDALRAGVAAKVRDDARRVALEIAGAASALADHEGDFARRFEALRIERDAARRAAFNALARAPRPEVPEDVLLLATDPGVRVFFAQGPFGETRVYLAGEETPEDRRAAEAREATTTPAAPGELATDAA